MATFSKTMLNQAVSGTPILIAATATPGTSIHLPAVAGEIHEVWMWATNVHTAAVVLTVEFGGATSGFVQKVTIPAAEGLFSIVPGIPILSGVTVKAFAATANVVNVWGFVNKIV